MFWWFWNVLDLPCHVTRTTTAPPASPPPPRHPNRDRTPSQPPRHATRTATAPRLGSQNRRRTFRERSCGANECLLTNIPRTFLWCQRMLADEFSRVLESSLTTQQHRLVPRARRAQYAVCAFSIGREAPLRGALSDRTNAVAHRHASKVREQEREPAAAALMPSDDAIRASSSPTRDLAHTRTHHARPTRTRQATHITRAHRPRHPFDVGVVADARRRATSS